MFERRLKIFLGIIFLVAATLLVRAAERQIVEHKKWVDAAEEAMTRSRPIETTRGRILDFRGRTLAVDQPCVDACIDYRALSDPPDEDWIKDFARRRLRERLGSAYTDAPRSKQNQLRVDEVKQIKSDIDSMWDRLAKVSGSPVSEVEDARQAVIEKVELRRRSVWFRNYAKALELHERKDPPPLWRRWLLGETDEAPDRDSFQVDVEEQYQEHVILRAIPPDVQNEIGKYIDHYPGLALRPGTHRYYPFNEVACHVVGNMAKVTREDLRADPWFGKDERRRYFRDDLIGRAGIESLCESLLRGVRGRHDAMAVAEGAEGWRDLPGQAPEPGKDVQITLDAELQKRIEKIFQAVRIKNPDKTYETLPMHGAAVVIDVSTGEVRAMASNPTFDLNTFDREYPRLLEDKFDLPMMNRATQSQLEPGSTMKPVVGLSVMAAGLATVTEGVECTGYLVVNGRAIPKGFRCWTASNFGVGPGIDAHVAHHPFPYNAPHAGRFGNPDGSLVLSDAIERSCNIYFETMAGRLGTAGLQKGMARFGLGRPTGVGIAEAPGLLPFDKGLHRDEIQRMNWWAGIGQGRVNVTPIQMANVAATIARDGVWMRPRLVPQGVDVPTTRPSEPDRVDLGLPPEAIAAVKEGMINVVNSAAGTGKQAKRDDVLVAGKTGTATAAALAKPVLDVNGDPVKDEKGHTVWEKFVPSTNVTPNTVVPWYRGFGDDGKRIYHSWYIGFVPAEKPKLAFAVMVEYGGSGGETAGTVAGRIIEEFINLNYFPVTPKQPQQPKAAADGEMLRALVSTGN